MWFHAYSCIFEHVFIWPPWDQVGGQGQRSSWIIQSLYSSLRTFQLRSNPHLRSDKGLAMVVITVKELKEPFTVLRPEEFLDNNRFPCGNILILLQKKIKITWTLSQMLGPGRCLNTSTVATMLPGCLVAALFFWLYRFLLPHKKVKESVKKANIRSSNPNM